MCKTVTNQVRWFGLAKRRLFLPRVAQNRWNLAENIPNSNDYPPSCVFLCAQMDISMDTHMDTSMDTHMDMSMEISMDISIKSKASKLDGSCT